MPADPVAAGRKGGSRNTPAQQEARKKGQFQRVYPRADEQDLTPALLERNSTGEDDGKHAD